MKHFPQKSVWAWQSASRGRGEDDPFQSLSAVPPRQGRSTEIMNALGFFIAYEGMHRDSLKRCIVATEVYYGVNVVKFDARRGENDKISGFSTPIVRIEQNKRVLWVRGHLLRN